MSCCGSPDIAQLKTEALAGGDEIRPMVQTVFVVPDMHCAGCMHKIETGLTKLPLVDAVRANLSSRQVSVRWSEDRGTLEDIDRAISALGFEHQLAEESSASLEHLRETGKKLLLCLAVAGFAAANIMLLSVSVWSGADAETARLFGLISGLIAVPAVIYAGRPFFTSALGALSARKLNMDVPISLAVLLSLLMSLYEAMAGGGEVFFDASVMLLFFLLIGRTLDHFMRAKAAGGVQSLAKLLPEKAWRIADNGSLRTIGVSEIEPGIVLRLLAGDRLPVNAKVVAGSGVIDRSIVTGESDPVSVRTGTILEAGILNLDEPIDVEAVADARASFLADVIDMMNAAENGRGHYRRIADRMAEIYAPAVHLLALFTFIGWMVWTGDVKSSLVAGIAVLIITCPCALGLAVPVTHVVAANRLFKRGILMRDGSALERLAQADTALFDKTGTLTEAALNVRGAADVLPEHVSPLLALARQSNHPAAKAVAARFATEPADEIDGLRERPGLGVEGSWQGRTLRLGRPSWAGELAGGAIQSGKATLQFSIEGGATYGFHLTSALKPEAPIALKTLQNAGLKISILSGDIESNVTAVAREVNLGDAHSELTPAEKTQFISNLQEDGAKVLMVGDGLNDAPALATAHVSMAPASAIDISRASADFVFTRASLMDVPFAWRLAKAAEATVKQNFGLAIFYNVIAVPLAVAGFVTPLFAAIAMSLSSIVVVANSMRLTIRDLEGRGEAEQPKASGHARETPLPQATLKGAQA